VLETISICSTLIAPPTTTTNMTTNNQFLAVVAQVEAQLNDASSLSPLTPSPTSSYHESDIQLGDPQIAVKDEPFMDYVSGIRSPSYHPCSPTPEHAIDPAVLQQLKEEQPEIP
jgi:hypothetical protein